MCAHVAAGRSGVLEDQLRVQRPEHHDAARGDDRPGDPQLCGAVRMCVVVDGHRVIDRLARHPVVVSDGILAERILGTGTVTEGFVGDGALGELRVGHRVSGLRGADRFVAAGPDP